MNIHLHFLANYLFIHKNKFFSLIYWLKLKNIVQNYLLVKQEQNRIIL